MAQTSRWSDRIATDLVMVGVMVAGSTLLSETVPAGLCPSAQGLAAAAATPPLAAG